MINTNSVVQIVPDFKGRPYRFRIVCGESKTGTDISAPDAKSMEEWMYIISLVTMFDIRTMWK